MTTPRRTIAQSNPSFGRRAPRALGDDAKLFALTFLGGFLFISVYLA